MNGFEKHFSSIQLSDYEKVKKVFLGEYQKIPHVVSIYSFGDTTVSGISDLNFAVIVEDSIDKKCKLPDCKYFNNTFGNILNDNPFIFSKSMIWGMTQIFNFKNLTYECGEKVQLEKHCCNYDNQLLILIDVCSRLYSMVSSVLGNKDEKGTGYSVHILNTFCYSVDLFHRLNNATLSPLVVECLDEIKEYQLKFPSRSIEINELEIKRLIFMTANALIILIEALDKYIINNYWGECDYEYGPIKGVYCLNGHIFMDGYNFVSAVDIMDFLCEECKGLMSVLPTSFIYPLSKYRSERGIVSKAIDDNLEIYSGKFVTFNDVEKTLKDRINALNEFCSFYENNLSILPIYDYYQPDNSNINNDELKKICQRIETRFMNYSNI
ncbi:MAG: hypothetical protein WC178_05265 [Candidatus Paceibacterota bacterium]